MAALGIWGDEAGLRVKVSLQHRQTTNQTKHTVAQAAENPGFGSESSGPELQIIITAGDLKHRQASRWSPLLAMWLHL